MKKDWNKDPLIVAVSATFIALLYLPGASSHDGQFSSYRWIHDIVDVHWMILAVELLAIWSGFFLYKHYFKPEENE